MGEEQAIEPVGPKIRREGLQRFRVARLAHVVRDVEELDAPEAEQARAVRVALAIGEGVVLAMDGHPLLPALPVVSHSDDAEQKSTRPGATATGAPARGAGRWTSRRWRSASG